jgi:hypothetical protein
MNDNQGYTIQMHVTNVDQEHLSQAVSHLVIELDRSGAHIGGGFMPDAVKGNVLQRIVAAIKVAILSR